VARASRTEDSDKTDAKRRGKRKPRARRRPGVRRLIAAAALLPLAGRAPLYARLLWSLILDERTPMARKALLAGALGYIVLPIDVFPDRVPVLGQLDDLVVTALATDLFLDGLDEALLAEKLAQAGIPRAAFEEDVERIRRLVPGPVRRFARRLPGAVRFISSNIPQQQIRHELRRWLAARDSSTAGPTAELEGSRA
jgi:uncharacterized membrane protein YkvA (DUF1232 family)